MPNKKPLKVLIRFELNSNFEQEFLEFLETVLSWTEEKKDNQKNEKICNSKTTK